jgi:predicted RNase H-like HicB family nuclease
MARGVRVPYRLEQDEDGVWCAHAQLRPGVGANGQGTDPSEAAADLELALTALVDEFGAPELSPGDS